MERTPRLSSASGVTLICLGNVVQHAVSVRVYFYVGVAFNVVWWAMTILTPLIAGDWDLEKSGRLTGWSLSRVREPTKTVFAGFVCWCHECCSMCS